MSDNPAPTTFEHPDAGAIVMIGRGPWRLYANGDHSQEIRDADNKIANPTVIQKFSKTGSKANRNVIFARRDVTASIVELANQKLDEQQA